MKNFIILVLAAVFCLANAYIMATTTTICGFVMSFIGISVGAVVATLADNNKF